MRTLRKLFLFLCTAAYSLTVSYPLALLFRITGCVWDLRIGSDWIAEARITPRGVWLMESLPWMRGGAYSVTIGRFIAYHPTLDTANLVRIAEHERVHVRQFEDASLVGLLVGAVAGITAQSVWLFLAIWWTAPSWIFVYMLTACMRYGFSMDVAYRDAEHERSAYAQTDQPLGKPWYRARNEARS